ncbi:MAG: DUF4446 family protein [Lachnospiraceae bacterium]
MGVIIQELGTVSSIVILVLIVFLIVSLMCIINLTLKISRLERKYKYFMKGKDGQSLEKVFAKKFGQIDKLMETNEIFSHEVGMIKKSSNQTFSKYGVEKYDAFEDVGGKMSFVLALLDKKNTGIILNAIHSRDNCFLYIKEIVKGESFVMLSEEEVKALRTAVNFDIEEMMES